MQLSYDTIKSISHDTDRIYHGRPRITFTSKYPVSNRNEIPHPGDIIEADLGSHYVDAYVTEVKFHYFESQVELSAEVVECIPIPAIQSFDFDPSTLKQQLASLFPHAW